jgi:predicted small lipoprotein YifL
MYRFLLVILACSTLSGCGNNIFSKYSPDEFAVMRRAPLSLPPDYTVRPPQQKATQATTEQMSESEQAFLANANADQSSSDIREKFDDEAAQLANSDEALDPVKEEQRLNK